MKHGMMRVKENIHVQTIGYGISNGTRMVTGVQKAQSVKHLRLYLGQQKTSVRR